MNLNLVLIKFVLILIKGYFKTLMGHASSLCLVNAGGRANEHAPCFNENQEIVINNV